MEDESVLVIVLVLCYIFSGCYFRVSLEEGIAVQVLQISHVSRETNTNLR